MQTHRRLTVAGLGSFLSKEDGSDLLFTEFVKADDGVLLQLLVDRGVNEYEAATAIESLVFDAKAELSKGDEASFVLPSLGLLKSVGGRVVFEYDHTIQLVDASYDLFDQDEEAELQEVAAETEKSVVLDPEEIEDEEIQDVEIQDIEVQEPVVISPVGEPKPKSSKERRAKIADIMREASAPSTSATATYASTDTRSLYDRPIETVENDDNIRPPHPVETPKKSVDWVVTISIIVSIAALGLIFYTMASSWMIGEITLPEPLESMLERAVFGEPDAADMVIEKVTE